MITRDAVQGFIDGHKMAHPPTCLKECTELWLLGHPLYKPDELGLRKILDDLGSYRQ